MRVRHGVNLSYSSGVVQPLPLGKGRRCFLTKDAKNLHELRLARFQEGLWLRHKEAA
jgi:hypothetical protein